ncbi:hypothetical protein MCGE09_00467 [Thaumarchaeota archaeon SCGC AB-539-E09]|nr:hypothetical protein MCGE09_00467 [Thaumarchaeota archaeon SCGC AB-539-E09]
MNICIISPFPFYAPPYNLGTINSWWKELSYKHNIYVISPFPCEKIHRVMINDTNITEFRVPAYEMKQIPCMIPYFNGMLKTITYINRKYGLDLLHSIKTVFPSSLYSLLFSKHLKIPLISSIHGMYQYFESPFIKLFFSLYTFTITQKILMESKKIIIFSPKMSLFIKKFKVPNEK